MGFKDYSETFKTSLPAFPRTEVSLDKLIAAWEKLRELDIAGYRTSQGSGKSAFLARIQCADGALGPSEGHGVSCSPFTATALMMALSDGGPPYQPKLSDGTAVTKLFNNCVNGNLTSKHKGLKQFGLDPKRDNGWVRACVAFNLATAIHPTEMRRGDAVGIDWNPRGGHAVYCWDVHLDANDKVDAFLYISSNGMIKTDPLGGAGPGVTIGGCTQNLKKVDNDPATGQPRYKVLKTPFFEDEEENVRRGAWVTWLSEEEAKKIDLHDGRCRVAPKVKHPAARIRALEVARFHGMVRPEPYAMGGAPGKPPVHIPEVEAIQVPEADASNPEKVKQKAKPVDQKKEEPTLSQLMVEQRLKALYVLGIIDKDNGEPDEVNDPQTKEAVKAFQKKYDLKVDGIAGPKTKGKLKEIWAEVGRSPQGQHYLATGQKPGKPTEALKIVLGFFWRHGTAKPGDKVKLHVVASGFDGKSFPIQVKDSVSGKIADTGTALKVEKGVGIAEVSIPNESWGFGSSAWIFAVADGLGQSFAPLYLRGKDVTDVVQVLGNPTEKRWPSGEWIYARNPWSLRAFEGKIYVGSGNSNNPPPASNAGPVDLWALDARSGTFPEKPEYEIRDEQVDVFRILPDGLWIPGHDARVTGRDDSRVKGESKFEHLKRLLKTAVSFPADWAAGNVHHRLAPDVWETLPYIPNGIHVYDVFDFGGELFAAIATVAGGMVARSRDRGKTWKEILTKPFPYSRTRTLFALEDDTGPRLYASTNGGRIYRYDGKSDFAEMNVRFFPGISELKEVFAARPTGFRKEVVYIAGRRIIDHDWTPLGLFAAANADSARALPLPGGALARDLVVRDDVLYVLASTQPSARSTRVDVFATRDLTTFTEICFFDAETFARSFETLDGDFYFGLGCDPEALHPHTGRILKVPASALSEAR